MYRRMRNTCVSSSPESYICFTRSTCGIYFLSIFIFATSSLSIHSHATNTTTTLTTTTTDSNATTQATWTAGYMHKGWRWRGRMLRQYNDDAREKRKKYRNATQIIGGHVLMDG